MSRDRRPAPKVHRETVELARSRARAAASLAATSDLSPEQQVWLLKRVCRELWGLLDQRRADGLPSQDNVWDMLSVDARAAVDASFEAALVLFGRDGVHVEPCRRITDASLEGGFMYLLVLPDGQKRVVREDELLLMAGV